MNRIRRSLAHLSMIVILTGLVPMIASVQAASPLQSPIRFDFGVAGSPVEPGYTAVIPQDIYSATKGYGWVSRVAGANRNDPKMSALLKDLAYARDATLKVNLDPTKTYDIKIYHANPRDTASSSVNYVKGIYNGNPSSSKGTSYIVDNFSVSAEGTVRYHIPVVPSGGTMIRTISNVIISKDGVLKLRFRDLGGRDNNFVVSGLEITSKGQVCGNRKVEAPEQCDDGNVVGGDGCSAACAFECTDSDSGSTLIRGTVTVGRETFEDQCELGKLREYSCENGKMKSEIIHCLCASEPDMEGVCIEQTTCSDTEHPEDPPAWFQDPFVAGTVTWRAQNSAGFDVTKQYADECRDATHLIDESCSPGGPGELVGVGWGSDIVCDYGCVNGACLPPPVNDVATLLLIEQKLANNTVVGNSQNITLFKFEATAGKAEDIFATQFVFKADVGSLTNAGDYTLWVDTDDNGTVDTILETGRGCEGSCSGAEDSNDRIRFEHIVGGGYIIPEEKTVTFEVHADIAGSLVGTSLAIGFADVDAFASFIEAEEADAGTSLHGICVDGVRGDCGVEHQIDLTTTISAVFTLRQQGSLFIAKSMNTPRSRQLLAGALGDSVLNLELRAEDEPIDVTRLVFTNSGTVAGAQNVNRLLLYKEGESQQFAAATLGDCAIINNQTPPEIGDLPPNSFCAVMNNQQLVVLDGTRVNILVRPEMKNDANGAVNGPAGVIQLALLKPSEYATPGTSTSAHTASTVVAMGFESSNDLLINDGDAVKEGEIFVFSAPSTLPAPDAQITGNENDTVYAKIVTIKNVNPDPNGSAPGGFSNVRIARFKFTAAANMQSLNGQARATFDRMTFTVTSANMEFDTAGFDLVNVSNPLQEISCTSTSVAAEVMLVECLRMQNTAVDLAMDSGESMTLELQADILNPMVLPQTSTLQVSLTDFADRSMNPSASHIRWSDSLGVLGEQFFHWIEYGETMIPSTLYRM